MRRPNPQGLPPRGPRVRGVLSLTYPQVQDTSHNLWVIQRLEVELSGMPVTGPDHPSRDG